MTSTPDPDKATPANSNDTHWLEIGVVEDRFRPGHWLVEAVDHQSEGEIYRATFDGPDAEKRARAYAETLKPSAAVEAEVAELVARIQKRVAEINEHVDRYPSQRESTTWQHAEDLKALLDLLTRLASEKVRLEGLLKESGEALGAASHDATRHHALKLKAEADLSSLKQRVAEVLEPFAAAFAGYELDGCLSAPDWRAIRESVIPNDFRRAAELHASLTAKDRS